MKEKSSKKTITLKNPSKSKDNNKQSLMSVTVNGFEQAPSTPL